MAFSRANMDWTNASKPRPRPLKPWIKPSTCMALVGPIRRWATGSRRWCTQVSSPRHPPPAGCPATGTQAHDLSCQLELEVQLRSALPQWPTSPSSRFADSNHFRSAEVTNLNQDLTFFSEGGVIKG